MHPLKKNSPPFSGDAFVSESLWRMNLLIKIIWMILFLFSPLVLQITDHGLEVLAGQFATDNCCFLSFPGEVKKMYSVNASV